jgi:hypothetical protein
MVQHRASLLGIAATLLLACANVPPGPPPSPPADDGGVLAASVKLSRPGMNAYATRLHFVRLEEGDDPYYQKTLLSSNFLANSDVFIVNALPGQYALVAAERRIVITSSPVTVPVGGGFSIGHSGMSSENIHIVYLPGNLIDLTIVEVNPGEIAFIGEIELKLVKIEDADPAQSHYYELFAPGHGSKGVFAKSLDVTKHHRGTRVDFSRDADAERRFLERTKTLFTDAGWPSGLVYQRVPVTPRETFTPIQIVVEDAARSADSGEGANLLERMLQDEFGLRGLETPAKLSELILEVKIVQFELGSATKRMLIGFGAGKAQVTYTATLRDASQGVLGETDGHKQYTGFELNSKDNPGFKGDDALRRSMAEHCAAELTEFVREHPTLDTTGESTAK